jgi:hypothetical protein
MSTGHEPDKPAADDVAADMERRLDELGEHIEEAEREERRLPEKLTGGIAGDQTTVHEGPLSGGATPSGAEPAAAEDGD